MPRCSTASPPDTGPPSVARWGIELRLVAASLAAAAPGPLVVVLAHGDDIETFAQRPGPVQRSAGRALPPRRARPPRARAGRREFRPAARCSNTCWKIARRGCHHQHPGHPAARAAAGGRARANPRWHRPSRRTGPAQMADRAWLSRSSAVEMPGELSHRGGILDLFARRLERAGADRILRRHDRIDPPFRSLHQRSLDTLDSVEVTALRPQRRRPRAFHRYLPAKSWLALVEPRTSKKRGGIFWSGWKIPTTPTA